MLKYRLTSRLGEHAVTDKIEFILSNSKLKKMTHSELEALLVLLCDELDTQQPESNPNTQVMAGRKTA